MGLFLIVTKLKTTINFKNEKIIFLSFINNSYRPNVLDVFNIFD